MSTHLRAEAPTFVPQYAITPSPSVTPTSNRSRTKTTTRTKQKKKTSSLQKDDEQQQKRSVGYQRRKQRYVTTTTPKEQKKSSKSTLRSRQKKLRQRQDPSDHREMISTVQPGSQNVEIFRDDAFPSLRSVSDPKNFRKQGVSSAWDNQSKDILIQCRESGSPTSCNNQNEDNSIENNESLNCFSRLTVLRKSKAHPDKDDSRQDSAHSKEIEPSTIEEPFLPNENLQPLNQKTKLDLDKLRNRWWAVVKNRPPPNPVSGRTESKRSDPTGTATEYQIATAARVYQEDHLDDNSVDSSYLEVDDPLSEAVRRNDEDTLRSLLKSSFLESFDQETTVHHTPSPLQLAVDLERPGIVQVLVSAARKGAVFLQDNPRFPPALLVAVERGSEEILHIILQSSFGAGSYFTNTKDANGNNVFHACCKSTVPSSVLRLLIAIPNASGFAKLLSSTNDLGQNPVHVVCEQGNAELLDILLSSTSSLGGSFTLLSKVLSMQDSIGQTPLLSAVANGSSDCVMSLLMWRGNNHQNLIPKRVDLSPGESPPCSLAWAVKAQDLDMVLLLLEFSDSNGSGYDLIGALQVAVLMRQRRERKTASHAGKVQVLLTIMRVLVEAGANPCTFIEEPFPNWVIQHFCYSRMSGLGRCALVMSAEERDSEAVNTLLNTYDLFLSRLRSSRRKDPVLAQQPESFFAGIEAKERSERTTALRISLITSLVAPILDQNLLERESESTSSTLVLYQSGVKLGLSGLRLLQACLKEKSLKLLENSSLFDSVQMVMQYRASYNHPLGQKVTNRSDDTQFWSRTLLKQPWSLSRESISGCSWIRSMEKDELELQFNLSPDFVIISEDGQRFETHSQIICQKSEKLAAAFRFANMRSPEDTTGLVETNVSLCGKLLSFLLYHMYLGSLPTAATVDDDPISSESLLELLLLGEEFMCPTLIQECELRLILSPLVSRQCFCPSCSLRRQPENECVVCTIGGKGSLLANQST